MSSGESLEQRLANLSPGQRALLEQRLLQRQTTTAKRNLISRRADDGPAPLSYAQELLWLLSQVFDGGVAYNSPGAFQLIGPLDLELLGKALNGLLERHSILRTTYTVIGDRPVQIIGEGEPLEINFIDLRGCFPTSEPRSRSGSCARSPVSASTSSTVPLCVRPVIRMAIRSTS